MNTLVFYRARSVTTFHFHRMQLTTVNRYVKLCLSLQLSECVPVLTSFVVTTRPAISSRPCNPLSAFFLNPGFCLCVHKIVSYLLTWNRSYDFLSPGPTQFRAGSRVAVEPGTERKVATRWRAISGTTDQTGRAAGCRAAPITGPAPGAIDSSARC